MDAIGEAHLKALLDDLELAEELYDDPPAPGPSAAASPPIVAARALSPTSAAGAASLPSVTAVPTGNGTGPSSAPQAIAIPVVSVATSAPVLNSPSQAAAALSEAVELLKAVADYQWHQQQVRFEQEFIDRQLKNALAKLTQKARDPTQSDAKQQAALARRESEMRLAAMRRAEECQRAHFEAAQHEQAEAARVAALVRQTRELEGPLTFPEIFTLEESQMQKVQADALEQARYNSHSAQPPPPPPSPIRELFYQLPRTETRQKLEGLSVSCAALDESMQSHLVQLLESETETDAAYSAQVPCGDHVQRGLSSYLQCAMRVPPFAMDADARKMLLELGLSVGPHAFGALATAFCRAFRELYGQAVQRAISALATPPSQETPPPETEKPPPPGKGTLPVPVEERKEPGNGGEGPPEQGDLDGMEPLGIWLRRANHDLCEFMVCLHTSLLWKWPALQTAPAGSLLAMEAVVASVLRLLPEVAILFQGTYLREDRALRGRIQELLTGDQRISLTERLGVPQRGRLCPSAPPLSMLTGPSDLAHIAQELDRQSAQAYGPAIAALQRAQAATCPVEKAHRLQQVVRLVCSCVSEDYRGRGEAPPSMSADDLLPVLSFLVVQGYVRNPPRKSGGLRLDHLRSQVELMEALLPSHMKTGEPGYCLAVLTSAIADLTSDGASRGDEASQWGPDSPPRSGGGDTASESAERALAAAREAPPVTGDQVPLGNFLSQLFMGRSQQITDAEMQEIRSPMGVPEHTELLP